MGPTQFIKYLPFSPRGGGGGISGKSRLTLFQSSLTLFQSNIYEVNVREYPTGFSKSLLILLLFGFFVLSG